MREGLSRGALLLVVTAFCLPLFAGLGRTELGNDEAIYTYAAESILETGDWLSPRSSPNQHIAFLEKPPLKFWLVAAPLRLGLLPRSEFGWRFWDALLGGLAFLYVFALGSRIAGALCGVTAVLLLFAHDPLIFEHGLRSNNMEASLLLAYCGFVYHVRAWMRTADPGRSRLHIGCAAAFFFLGFMTKFVAAAFMPLVGGVVVLATTAGRRALARDGWMWLAAGVGAAGLAAPWFVYQWLVRGDMLWTVIFGEHVVTRFTAYADPAHVQPWHFYFSEIFREFTRNGSSVWIAAGAVLLAAGWRTERRADALLLFTWALLPLVLISFGTSKIYHYAYPFLPAMALVAGVAVQWLWDWLSASAAVRRAAAALDHRRVARASVRIAGISLAAAGAGIAIWTAVQGAVRLEVGDVLLLRNTTVARPLLFAAAGGILSAAPRTALAGAVVLVLSMLIPGPVTAYATNVERLGEARGPLRALAACLQKVDEVRRSRGEEPPDVYAPVSHGAYLHPYFFYLRGRGWHGDPDNAKLEGALYSDDDYAPVAIDRARYAAFLQGRGPSPPTAFLAFGEMLVLLPRSYEVCAGASLPRR